MHPKIGVLRFVNFSDLLSGNFERPSQPLLTPRTRVKPDHIISPSLPGTNAKPDNIIVVNPSVVFHPLTSKYHLYFKGNLYDPHWRGVHGVAISDYPDRDFVAQDSFVMAIHLENHQIANSEDPFVWFNPTDQKFHAIVKDFTGRITQKKSGLARLISEDGVHWKQYYRPLFMEKKLTNQNGLDIKVSHLERPQLLLNQGIPQVLYAACSLQPAGNKINGGTFNVHIPLQCE